MFVFALGVLRAVYVSVVFVFQHCFQAVCSTHNCFEVAFGTSQNAAKHPNKIDAEQLGGEKRRYSRHFVQSSVQENVCFLVSRQRLHISVHTDVSSAAPSRGTVFSTKQSKHPICLQGVSKPSKVLLFLQ